MKTSMAETSNGGSDDNDGLVMVVPMRSDQSFVAECAVLFRVVKFPRVANNGRFEVERFDAVGAL